jgi:hypothetical protein
MKAFYLVLAIVGAILPYVFFVQYFATEGVGLAGFSDALFVNGAAGGFATDLFVASFIFWAFMIHQSRRQKGPRPALFIVLNLLIGLSCALPAYLYARERKETAA